MYDDEAGEAAEPVGKMVCNREDFKDFCTSTRRAYTMEDEGEFHICLLGMESKLNAEISCDDLDASCSLKMRSLPMTLLHDMTHYNSIGAAARGSKTIIDVRKQGGKGAVVSGAYHCSQLGSEDKTDNVQSYAWFAGEAY